MQLAGDTEPDEVDQEPELHNMHDVALTDDDHEPGTQLTQIDPL